MRSSARSLFTTIRTEGAILPSELLERIAKGKDFEGLSADSYHLLAGQKLNEVIERSWKQVLVAWRGFKDAREKSGNLDATGTSLTRERWLYPLFQELGFGRMPAERKAREIEGREYFISHYYDHVPIHLIGYKVLIDRRTPGIPGAAKTAPHSLVQEFLNRTEEHLWAIVSNGLRLRLLRDNKSLTRQAYVEFDLEAMLEGEAFADFRVLWLLCHQSRFEGEKPTDCWLENWSKIAGEQGVRALDRLRGGVEEAIRALGKGFLAHRANHHLRSKLRDGQLDRQDYYRQLLRVVYRLLFLFVAEDRDLLLLPELQGDEPDDAKRQRRLARVRYQQHYGTQRLRSLSQTIRGTQHPDLWRGLQLIMRGIGQEGGIPALAVPALGSYLWSEEACPDLAGMNATPAADIANADLLKAIRVLAVIEVEGRRTVVNYAHLRSEELGSVYESLLELHPQLNAEAGTFDLHSAAGNERKTTGSYYTPDSLVQCLLDSALESVMDEKEDLARKVARKIDDGAFEMDKWTPEEIDLIAPRGQDPQEALATRMVELGNLDKPDLHRTLGEAAILGMKVCDPACGSGHFLISAAQRLARRLARVRTGDEEPAPEALQHALRDVIGHCIYGVDINPMSVELCKVALWMEAMEPGKPLTFLDHHIKCGNSLLGTTPALVSRGIPDGAFKPITGDDRSLCAALKKRNKEERRGQHDMFAQAEAAWNYRKAFEQATHQIERMPDDDLSSIQKKQAAYEAFLQSLSYVFAKRLHDAWCAAFVCEKEEDSITITQQIISEMQDDPNRCPGQVRELVERIAEQYQFFHWHLEFPDVFQPKSKQELNEEEIAGWTGGFDCILGNPPWERIKLQEKEFFATRNPDIANAPNAAARRRMIARLPETDPPLHRAFRQALRQAEGESGLVRDTGRFPLCGRGDVNTYSIFAELKRALMNPGGRVGCIVPSGIATDDTTKFFFQNLTETRSLVALYDFENAKPLFPGVHRSYKFYLLTLTGAARPHKQAEFVFFAHAAEELAEPDRRFTLSAEDIELLNPNTRTCPIFRSRKDAALTKHIYRRVPVLIREARDGRPEENPWGVKFNRMFDMSNDSHLFRTREQLEAEGYVLRGNVFEARGERSPQSGDAGLNHVESSLIRDESSMKHGISSLQRADGSLQSDDVSVHHGKSSLQQDDASLHNDDASLQRNDAGLTPASAASPSDRYLPLYEAKMIHHFDHRWATYDGNPPSTRDLSAAEKADPTFAVLPRYWVRESDVHAALANTGWTRPWLLGWRDITNTTNERTVIAGLFNLTPVGNKIPLILSLGSEQCEGAFLSTCLNSLAQDFAARQKIGGTTLNFFLFQQLPILPPETYAQPCPWGSAASSDHSPSLRDFLLPRVLELTCTAWDLEPFARDCGYDGPPFPWDEARRFQLRCELDAAFFHLYLGDAQEWRQSGTPELLDAFPTPRDAVDYILETFPIVKRKDEKAHGTYRTKVAILELYDEMAVVMRQNADAEATGRQSMAQYQTSLNPPPGPPFDTEGNYLSMYQLDRDNWPSHIHPPRSDWDNSLLDTWFGVCQKQWTHLDDAQVFPWDGREAFVYALIPFLVREKSGERFEFYRDAALLASHQERCETLLLKDDLKSQYRAIMAKLDWLRFPDTHRVRIGEVRRRLQDKQLIATVATSGATNLVDEQRLPSFPMPLQPLLPLILSAANNLARLQEGALEDAEAENVSFAIEDITDDLTALTVA